MAPPPDGSASGGSSSSSAIRVFVRWHDQTVFAGEEVKCTITFKNVAPAAPPPSSSSQRHQPTTSASSTPSSLSASAFPPSSSRQHQHQQQRSNNADRRKSHPSPLLAAQARHPSKPTSSSSSSGLAPPRPTTRGHRGSHSISGPPLARSRAGSVTWPPPPPSQQQGTANSSKGNIGGGGGGGGGNTGDGGGSGGSSDPSQDHHHQSNGSGSHRRSISIVSLGSPPPTPAGHGHASGQGKARPARGHARASSLQISPRGAAISGPRSASHPHRPFNQQPSPLFNASYPPSGSSGASTAPNTPGIGIGIGGAGLSPRPTPEALSGFKFPMTQTPLLQQTSEDDLTTPVDDTTPTVGPPARRNNDQPIPTITESNTMGPATAAARVLSTSSISGTPRSSTDGGFYSLSNNSTETLASEYVATQPHRTPGGGGGGGSNRPLHLRQRSNLSAHHRTRPPEALMMGYAQIQGSFTLDGSLVDLAPFEQVKRKAVVGGQGGGVIGVETQGGGNRRESGLLRSFGWGSITSSLGELLGGGELSSIKEMRGIAGAKAVPLLSTPQSILFVDLRLAPSESRTFEYSFRLPRGLPPTHKGKAMKISYSLVVGTQRPGGAKEQQLKSVDVPFRVLGSVNSHGEILGHDLMAPYVLLKDLAHVRTLEEGAAAAELARPTTKPPPGSSTMAGFLAYVEELVHRPRQGPHQGLLSPTADAGSRRLSAASSMFDEVASPAADTTAKEAIDLAILRSNLTAAGQQSANRFEIARNGRRVGVVTLARPAWRLGESVTMTVDFSAGEVPCYALHAALETAERVDPSLALRSEASVHRVTRRVYATSSEAAMYARRIAFSPTIPVSATPEFVTSGVSLEWRVRLEFVVPSSTAAAAAPPAPPSPHPLSAGANGGYEYGEDDGDDADDADSDTGSRRTERPALTPGGYHHQQPQAHPLLEEVSRDDRGGLVLVAAETLPCESFEVAVPLRVYGAVCNGLERLERDEAESGLAI